MDFIDAPIRPRQPKAKTSFQKELESKLKSRRKAGLSTDITPSESGGEDLDEDMDGFGDDDDYLQEYARTMHDRPQSAKRRQRPQDSFMQDTIKAGDASRFMKKKGKRGGGGGRGAGDPMLTTTKFSPGMFAEATGTGPSKEDIIFGRTSPGMRKSPTDLESQKPWQPPNFRKSPSVEQMESSTLRKSPFPDLETDSTRAGSPGSRGRRTPSIEPGLNPISELETPRQRHLSRGSSHSDSPRQISLDESLGSDKPVPPPRGRLGRKTPPIDTMGRKTPPIDTLGRKTPPIDSLGRKTPPVDSLGRKALPTDALGRGDRWRMEKEKAEKGRKTPPVDIFGKPQRGLDWNTLTGDDSLSRKEEDLMPALDGRKTPTDRKTPVGKQSLSGRQTPSGKQTPSGRQTPSGKQTASGKQTPTLGVKGQGRMTPEEEKTLGRTRFGSRPGSASGKAEKERDLRKERESPSLLDMLTGDIDKSKTSKESSAAQPKPRRPRQQAVSMRKSDSHDSITGELNVDHPSLADKRQASKEEIPDTSSLCAELDTEPFPRSRPATTEDVKSRKSGKKRAETEANEVAIDQVATAQNGIRPIHPDKGDKGQKRGTKSAEKHRPKPRYELLPGQKTEEELNEMNFEDTKSIREAIYKQWYEEKMKDAKKQLAVQKKKEKEVEEKKKKEELDKKLESTASYNAWMEKKKETLHSTREKKMNEEKKKLEEQHEKDNKKDIAEKIFKKWKEDKDEELKKEVRKKRREEEEKKRQEHEEKRMKRKESENAFQGWKGKKDVVLKTMHVEKKKTEKEKQKEIDEQRKKKEEDAKRQYYEWLDKKEQTIERERKTMRMRRMSSEEELRPAWSPASRTIPFGR